MGSGHGLERVQPREMKKVRFTIEFTTWTERDERELMQRLRGIRKVAGRRFGVVRGEDRGVRGIESAGGAGEGCEVRLSGVEVDEWAGEVLVRGRDTFGPPLPQYVT